MSVDHCIAELEEALELLRMIRVRAATLRLRFAELAQSYSPASDAT